MAIELGLIFIRWQPSERRVVKRYGDALAVNGVDLAARARRGARPARARTAQARAPCCGCCSGSSARRRHDRAPRPAAGGCGDQRALEGVGGFVEEPAFYPVPQRPHEPEPAGPARRRDLGRASERTRSPASTPALERVGLGRRGDDRVGGYSTGMRQRLGIAAALLRSPRLLLLDEPTSGLDPAGARAIATLVRELAADGVAILLSSHQIGELERVCTSYTFLREGRVVWDGTAAELEAQAPVSAFALIDQRRRAGLRARRRASARTPRSALATRGHLADRPAREHRRPTCSLSATPGSSIRRLELRVSPLESMFFALNSDDDAHLEQLEPDEFAERVLASA